MSPTPPLPSDPCQVTRAVQTLSALNQHRSFAKTTFRKYFYSRTHFPRILGGIMLASGVAGYTFMGWLHGRQIEERTRIYVEAYNNGERREDDGDGLIALARKMTRRVVDASRDATMESARLQRQVTKFW